MAGEFANLSSTSYGFRPASTQENVDIVNAHWHSVQTDAFRWLHPIMSDFDKAAPAQGEAPASAGVRHVEIVAPYPHSVPLVFSSPHSGSVYPPSFLAAARLDPLTLRKSEDAFVDELFLPALSVGAPMLRAHFPRAYLDVNREPYELDPRMFEGRLPAHANTRSVRVAGGLGTIARIVGDAQEIYRSRLPVAEALERIATLHHPYHDALKKLVEQTRRRFGMAILIDCHSMPSVNVPGEDGARADVIIGDRYGTSASPAYVECLEYEFRLLGYRVQRNKPYAGGYITEHYGAPSMGRHAIQIEFNRALYMNEARLERIAGFDQLSRDIATAMERFAGTLRNFGAPLAAE